MLQEKVLQFRGTILDLPPDEAGEDYWTYTENLFFRDKATQRFNGYESYYTATGENPIFVYPVQRKAVSLWIIVVQAGANCLVYRWDGTTKVDISNGRYTGIDGLALDWQATDLNGVIVLNNGASTPAYWDEVTTGFLIDLPDWPANTVCRTIRSFKFHLFAIHLADSVTENYYQYMWSDQAEPGGIPQSWTAAPATDAGASSFSTPQGFLVDSIPLRDSLIVLKDFSAHLVQYIGGAFIFTSRELYISAGMINIRCAVELNGKALIATQDDVIITDGSDMDSVCTHQVRRHIFENLNPEALRYCQVVKRHLYDEVWFCYPKGSSIYCNEAAIYNTRTERWGFRSLPNVSCLGYGLVNNPGAQVTWDSRDHSWTDDDTRWDSRFYSNTVDEIVMAMPYVDPVGQTGDGHVYVNNRGFTNDGVEFNAEARREGYLLEGPERIKIITELWPHIIGRAGDVINIQVGGALNEDSPITWQPAQPFVIGGDQGKIDVFSVGRWSAFRFLSAGGAPWRMYNFRVRYRLKGRF